MTNYLSCVALAAVDVDGAERTRGAEELAGAAAQAFVGVHRGTQQGGAAIHCHHRDGLCGAVPRTVAAADAVAPGQAVVLHHHGIANVDVGLFLARDGANGASRAHLAAARALRTAEAPFERHLGLQQAFQFSAGAQDTVGTLADAELTAGAP